MCVGDTQEEQHRNHNRRQQHQQQHQQQEEQQAYDTVPSIATLTNSTVWKQADIQYRTLQHLATFKCETSTYSTDPLYYCSKDHQLIVIGLQNGSVAIWNLVNTIKNNSSDKNKEVSARSSTQDNDTTSCTSLLGLAATLNKDFSSSTIDTLTAIQPTTIIDVTNPIPIAVICKYDQHDNDNETPSSSSSILVASITGTVSIMKPIVTTKQQQQISFQTSCTFYTGQCGMCSLTTVNDKILVGYDTGYIECYKLPNNQKVESPEEAVNTPTSTPLKKQSLLLATKPPPKKQFNVPKSSPKHSPKEAILSETQSSSPHTTKKTATSQIRRLWRGSFTRQEHVVKITALAQLHEAREKEDNKSLSSEYLIVTIQYLMQPALTASMVEVLDLNDIIEGDDISLEQYTITPDAGREIINYDTTSTVSTVHNNIHHQNHHNYLPSTGTNALVSLNHNLCIAALADGMIIPLTATIDEGEDNNLRWGISYNIDQYILSYPAIGIGTVEMMDEKLYTVCCLRGSTTYMIPINGIGPVIATSVPHDLDSDFTSRYVQSFTTFNHNVSYSGTTTDNTVMQDRSNIPCLLYVWPGGVIDIYAAGLLTTSTKTSTEYGLLDEMIKNQTIHKLWELLLTVDDAWLKQRDFIWTNARKEINNYETIDSITIQALSSSDTLKSFRNLLLQISA